MSSNAAVDTKQTDVEMEIENIEGRLFFNFKFAFIIC
jgi:hypothetical protein